jgi:hypothetical protein
MASLVSSASGQDFALVVYHSLASRHRQHQRRVAHIGLEPRDHPVPALPRRLERILSDDTLRRPDLADLQGEPASGEGFVELVKHLTR